jgi:hypothetical protein
LAAPEVSLLEKSLAKLDKTLEVHMKTLFPFPCRGCTG